MTALERITDFVSGYPKADILQTFRVDYTDQIPANGGIFPSGLEEVSRRTDIFGSVTVTNQYNFGLYYVFEKAPGDDTGAEVNASWVMDFQEWVQEQSVPQQERISAQNGVLYSAEDEGLATYMVQLTVRFIKNFPTTDPWFR